MHVYKDMITEVLRYGTRKENRTGVDTISTFNYNYELAWCPEMYGRSATGVGSLPPGALSGNRYVMRPVDGPGFAIPLLTTKKISWKNIVAEMLWFISGNTDIDILKRHKCKFWDAWADEDGKVPSAYGNFWRQFPVHTNKLVVGFGTRDHWEVDFNDQLAWVVDQLRTNPMSRRLVVSAWAPGNAQTSKLPPCHLLFAFNVQNVKVNDKVEQRLCLSLLQRSCDLFLGVPYNMASYGLLLLIFSHLTGIKPGIFAHTLIDSHIYTAKPDGSMSAYDHLPVLTEQLTRDPRPLPRLLIDPSVKELADIEALTSPAVSTEQILETFALSGYDPWPALKGKVAV